MEFKDFPKKLLFYLIFLLEKIGIIKRVKTESYYFSTEEYKTIFGKCSYFYYTISNEWSIHILSKSSEYHYLIDLLEDLIINNKIIH